MPIGWRMVRLRLGTVARLAAYRAELERTADRGGREARPNDEPGGGPASWDALVCDLLDRIDAHRGRARAQRAARRRGGAARPERGGAGPAGQSP